MSNRVIKCSICGNEFEPKVPNQKYCSTACKAKGKYLQRKKWEERTGFLEKQRQRMQNYRDQVTAEERAAAEAEAKKAEASRKRLETRRRNKAEQDLIRSAEQGDPFARMEIALKQSGNTSADYWEAYKDWVLRSDPDGRTEVNGISVLDPDFGSLVSLTVKEFGCVTLNG